MSGLDPATLRRFVELAGERLTGDWVILGGTVIPLLGGRHRVTADIEVAGPDDAGQDAVNDLLGIAVDLGLPVETINQAGAFHLRGIEGWRDELVPLHVGGRATIHTPSPTLYVLTKIARLTESDLDDCIAMLRLARLRGVAWDGARLSAAVEAEIATAPAPARAKRLDALAAAVRTDRGRD